MAKWSGKIGYAFTEEDPNRPSVYVERITERVYYGDVLRSSRRISALDKVNDDVDISNEISIVADPYAYENMYAIRYATFFGGTKWKVTDIEVQYPRLILTLGGVYNDH